MWKNVFDKVILFIKKFIMLKKGTSRIVLILVKLKIAIKFPNIRLVLFLSRFISFSRTWETFCWLFYASKNSRGSIRWFLLKGITDNWTEFVFFQKNKENIFLLPVYFSFFGLFNVCPVAQELHKNLEDSLWKMFMEKTEGEAEKDKHHFYEVENFGFWRGKLRMFDYGSSETQKIILNHFSALNDFSEKFVIQ